MVAPPPSLRQPRARLERRLHRTIQRLMDARERCLDEPPAAWFLDVMLIRHNGVVTISERSRYARSGIVSGTADDRVIWAREHPMAVNWACFHALLDDLERRGWCTPDEGETTTVED